MIQDSIKSSSQAHGGGVVKSSANSVRSPAELRGSISHLITRVSSLSLSPLGDKASLVSQVGLEFTM